MNKCGYVAVIGKPNAGKSTLINAMVGEKVSIVTAKPQTTRHQILAIKTASRGQILFIDTPGMHKGYKKALNQYMNRAASSVVSDVDVILFLVESLRWGNDDKAALQALKQARCPVILVINKADTVKQKEKLLPFANEMSQKFNFHDIFYISAEKKKGVEELESKIFDLLPASDNYFSEELLTDKPTQYLVSELIREQLTLRFHQELPYSLTVEVESYKETEKIVHIHALIWVEREPQKQMLIGKSGSSLKHVGVQARKEIEDLIGKKTNLKLWVKVKSAWADNDRLLQQLGYKDDF